MKKTNLNQPKFFTRPRDGKISLWVNVLGSGDWNICDLPKKYVNGDVLQAIAYAYALGVRTLHDRLKYVTTQSVDDLDLQYRPDWAVKEEEK